MQMKSVNIKWNFQPQLTIQDLVFLKIAFKKLSVQITLFQHQHRNFLNLKRLLVIILLLKFSKETLRKIFFIISYLKKLNEKLSKMKKESNSVNVSNIFLQVFCAFLKIFADFKICLSYFRENSNGFFWLAETKSQNWSQFRSSEQISYEILLCSNLFTRSASL